MCKEVEEYLSVFWEKTEEEQRAFILDYLLLNKSEYYGLWKVLLWIQSEWWNCLPRSVDEKYIMASLFEGETLPSC